MRTDALVGTQLLMAQAVHALAEHVGATTGSHLVPVAFSDLPAPPVAGMVSCISDSTVNTWRGVIAGGGTFTVLGFYNGTNWTVFG